MLFRNAIFEPKCCQRHGLTSPAQPREVCTLFDKWKQQNNSGADPPPLWSSIWRVSKKCHMDSQGWHWWLWDTWRNQHRVCWLACKIYTIQGNKHFYHLVTWGWLNYLTSYKESIIYKNFHWLIKICTTPSIYLNLSAHLTNSHIAFLFPLLIRQSLRCLSIIHLLLRWLFQRKH